jgi:hypothetical protein
MFYFDDFILLTLIRYLFFLLEYFLETYFSFEELLFHCLLYVLNKKIYVDFLVHYPITYSLFVDDRWVCDDFPK